MPTEEQTHLIEQVAISFQQIGTHWPPIYKEFYINWGYFNRIYDTLYAEGNRYEWQRIAFFALEHQHLWQWLDDLAEPLVSIPCVGVSTGDSEPEEHIRVATFTLRNELGIDPTQICNINDPKCSQRRIRCVDFEFSKAPNRIDNTNPKHAQHTPLGAALTIIYQIRNNLFHGGKFEFNGPEMERNLKLVARSNRFILELLRQYFRSLNNNQAPD